MNTNFSKSLLLALSVCGAGLANAQVTLSAMASFGGGDGWLAPAEYTGFGADLTRGMAYNAATGNLSIVSRVGGTNVRVLNGVSGAELGTMNMTGIAGGTFAANKVAISADGQVFVSNLTTSISPTASNNQFSVYRFTSEQALGTNGSASSLVFRNTAVAGTTLLNGGRLGDSFDAYGFGSSVALLAGYGANTAVAGTNGVARLDQAGAGTFTSQSFAVTGAVTGDYRLGITFINGNDYMGTQGPGTFSGASRARVANGSTLLGNATLSAGSERLMDVTTIGGKNYLATCDTVDNRVRIYDLSDPLAPAIIATNGTNTSITTATANVTNGNGVGDVRWGNFTGSVNGGYDGTLYVMNTNNGIQAYNVNVVPEPATMTALGLGVAAMIRRRKQSRK